MKLPRRRFLHLAAGAAALPAVSRFAKLNTEMNAGLADAAVRARLAELGGTVIPGSPADFGKLVADEIDKWGKVVKFSGAKPE